MTVTADSPHRDVVVLGSMNMDVVVSTTRIPRPGETVLGEDIRYLPGGKGANQAVAAGYLGSDVVFIGCTGDDDIGAQLRARLRRANVRVDHVRALPEISSGMALVVIDVAGENVIVVAPGANGRIAPTDLDACVDIIAGSVIAIAQLETPLPTVVRFAELCHQQGVPLLLNAAPYQPLPEALLSRIDYLVLNREEAGALTGVPTTDRASAHAACEAASARGVPHVVVTLGQDGCVALSDGRRIEVDAFPVEVVDSTGAGDAFTGALGSALARGDDLVTALRFAAATGALACRQVGAQQQGIPRSEVLELIAGQGPLRGGRDTGGAE